MLNRTPLQNCVECGKPMSAPDFGFHGGQRLSGPAYWSNEGLLCSPACAMAHVQRRRAEGREMREPAANPLERAPAFRR